MPATALKLPATLDEFLDWEERQPERWEYLDGVVRPFRGGTADLDRIAVSLAATLRPRLRGGSCFVHGSRLKVLSRAGNSVMYPKVFVRCGPPAARRTWIDDAVVSFEILPPSKADDDLTRKRLAYKAMTTMQVVVVVAQHEARLDIARRRADGSWADEVLGWLEASLELPAIGVRLTVADIYEDTGVARRIAIRSSAPISGRERPAR